VGSGRIPNDATHASKHAIIGGLPLPDFERGIAMQDTMEILKRLFVDENLIPKSKATDLDENVSLLETGIIDSLNLLKLILLMEERFQLKILDEDLTPENFETLCAMRTLINKKTG
jgi:acyl carrier protein